MKITKTNAMRQCDTHKINYQIYTYDTSDGHIDGISVANKCNQDPTMVYKTLVTIGQSKKIYVFVIGVLEELDLKKCAKAVKEKNIEMIAVKDLLNLTGYVRGGCSPIGMKKNYPVYVSETINKIDSIIFSGGKIGMQIHCSCNDFIKMTKAQIVDVKKDEYENTLF